MSEEIQIRTVTVELLRAGPAHNQLLSPLTLYLGVCDDAEAGIVSLPFEHSTFLRRMRAMQYDPKQIKEDRLPELRAMGVEMAKVLGAIPRLAGSLTGDSRGRDLMIHLSLVLSASELASLPFELAKMPIGPTSWTESWLALQARVPVVITRRTRNVSPRDFRWLFEPRILFISSNPDSSNVPFGEHKSAMLDAVWPFLAPDDLPGEGDRPRGRYYEKEDDPIKGGREQFGRVLTILTNPRFEDVVKECAKLRYTHIHILAHGDMDKSQGDPTSGLRLRESEAEAESEAEGVISGERLASAFTRMVGGVIHRPDVVTLATCDSGKQESVSEPGASIAHVLHQAGVPLVLASQFPLGKAASTLIVQEFYGGLLWGEHPWVLLHRVRSTLHGQLTAQDHDWASLVVYESMPVPPDLDYKLDRARLAQCENALRATWQRKTSDHQRSKAWPVKRVIEKMPLTSRFVGMQAGALKADALLLQAQEDYLQGVEGLEPDSPKYDEPPYKTLVINNCGLLEESLECYQSAVEGFLIYEGQGMSAPFMALLAQLRLSAVLGNKPNRKDRGRWAMARYWCETTLDKSDDLQEKIWANCCLAELWLLKLLEPPASAEEDVRQNALDAAHEVARLDRQRFSEPVRWTVAQLKNYGRWWGADAFERWVRNVCAGMPGSFQGDGGVVKTADAILNVIDKDSERRIRGLVTAGPRGHDRAVPASWPEADERAKAVAKTKRVAKAGTAVAMAPLPLPSPSPPPPPPPPPPRSPSPSRSPSRSPSPPATGQGRLGTHAAAPAVPTAKARSGSPPRSAMPDVAPFLSIEMLAAHHGDALWIEYGHAGSKPLRVLVDCGTRGGYKALKARVLKVPEAERRFELFILSHIDADHIGGAIPFLKDTEALGLSFGDVWFNGFKHLAPQRRLGAAQGESFSTLIQDKKLKWNDWQGGKAIVRPDDSLPSLTLAGGLKLTLLSPTRQQLAALALTWERDIKALGQTPGDIDDGRRRLSKRGAPDPNAEIDVDQLVDPKLNKFTADTSEPNGSSIAVLAEFEGRSVLLGADAYSSVLEQAVQLLKAGPGSAKLALNAFKLPHHASQNNLRPELLEMLECRDYLVSTSGSQFHHPDPVAIARVIRHGGLEPRLWFNYLSDETRVWHKPERQAQYGYTAKYPGAEGPGLSYNLFEPT